MTDKYRINPDFVVPEPSAANMFGFCKLDEFGDDEMRRQGDWMRAAGAKQVRVTIVNDDCPHEPYPHGFWFEGWTDENARQLPFGEAENGEGAIYPPLVHESGKLASGMEAPSGGETENTGSTEGESAVGESRGAPKQSLRNERNHREAGEPNKQPASNQ